MKWILPARRYLREMDERTAERILPLRMFRSSTSPMPRCGFGEEDRSLGFLYYSVAGLLILALFGCGGPISRTIDSQIKAENGGGSVDLRQAKGFDWEKLLIFGPYSYPTQICHDIGLSATECDNAKLKDVDEGQHLIVFLVGGRVTYHEEVSRRIVNFDEDILAKPIAKSEAMFLIERRSGGSPYLMHPTVSK